MVYCKGGLKWGYRSGGGGGVGISNFVYWKFNKVDFVIKSEIIWYNLICI